MGAAIACALSVGMTSCDDDDPEEEPEPPSIYTEISSNITRNTTWTKDRKYLLTTKVVVTNGATLTIEPGTIIRGGEGTGANATALIIARGAKINAIGTASEPIIFTTIADQITSGAVISPNIDPDVNGYWGGVIILGKAPIYASASELQVEGIPSSIDARYGGNDPADNSGTLQYVSIRHGGANIGGGNEINGLTLGGVGSGTVLDHIEIVGNQDDGIEWFGGTVNMTNALVWNVGDDGLDTDQGWSGTLDNFIVITPGGHNFELDGAEDGSTDANRKHTFRNGTVIAAVFDNTGAVVRQSSDLINVDADSEVIFDGVHITKIASGQKINSTSAALVDFINVTLDVSDSLSNYIAEGSVPSGLTASNTANATGKANASKFGWTWAAATGSTTDL